VIEIKTSFFPLAFLFAFFTPKASIDGGPAFDVGWGTTPIPGPPGRHQVEVWMPYLFAPNMGRNGIVVDVAPGGAVQVAWRAPWLVFLKGGISVGPAQGTAGAFSPGAWAVAPQPAPSASPGGWHADPAGRHEQRYYDGQAWTEHVVDAGVQSTDPLGS
jgi:hypothetical protein